MSQLKNIKMAAAQFNETVPSTNQQIKITPFKVGDEKVLLMASESKEATQMANALKQVVENCTIGVEGPLAHFDYEYLFLKLRAVSVGEMSTLGIECDSCKEVNKIEFDVSKVNVQKFDGHSRVVKLDGNLGFEMRYPDLEKAVNLDLESFGGILDLVCNCVSKVYHGDESIDVSPADHADLKGLIEEMTTAQFKEFQNFFETMPKLSAKVDFHCGGCNHPNNKVLEGLQSFF